MHNFMAITLITTTNKHKTTLNSNNLKNNISKYEYLQKIYNYLYKISKYDNLN